MLFFEGAILGASGIVFAMIMLSSFVYSGKGEIPLTFLLVAAIYLGGQVVDVDLSGNGSNVFPCQ